MGVQRPGLPPSVEGRTLGRQSVRPLSVAQLQSLLDTQRLAVFVFAAGRVAYQNPAGRALAERLRTEYGIELLVMLRDHLAGARGPGDASPPAVTLLIPPGGESFYVHARALPPRRGRPFLAASVREVGTEREAFGKRFGLSRRETQVVELLLRGHGNRDIASTLGITLGTTKKHLTRIFDKVGVDTRARLITRIA